MTEAGMIRRTLRSATWHVRFAPISGEFTGTPIKDEAGKLAGMSAVIRDVTKQLQEMRALNRKLDER